VPAAPTKTLGLPLLTFMVVGSMLATGAFTVPRSFAQATGPLGLVIVWLIACGGTVMLAFVFQTSAQRRPDLDAGIFAYAKAGFGAYAGFLSALGYWAGVCLLNVTYFVLIKSTLGAIVPAFGHGNTPQAVIAASVLLWAVHLLILRGVKKAAVVNAVVTAAKVAAVAAAVVILAAGFRVETFATSLWGGGVYGWADIPRQVQGALIVAVYAFIGIEGASVYSRYARRRADVGRATFLGLALVALLFVLLSLLPYGVLPRAEIAQLRNPSLAGVVGAVVGPWGAWFVGLALVVALAGAFLSRSLLAAEVLWSAARARTVPAVFATQNAKGAPTAALWLSSGLVQAFLLLTLVASEAYATAVKLTGAMILVPYLLVALFAVRRARREGGTRAEHVQAALAAVYGVVLLWAAGPSLLLASTLIYVPGTLLFWLARREQGRCAFTTAEAAIFTVLAIAAVVAGIDLAAAVGAS
jgi:arginine:ornithine antiporter/lysine permease